MEENEKELGTQPTVEKPEKKKDSTLSIWAGILSLFTCTFFIGAILGIIDLAANRNDGKRHGCSVFAIVWACLVLMIGVIKISNQSSDTSSSTQTETTTEAASVESTEEDTASVTDDGYVYVGESFETSSLRITVNDADTNFTNYEDEYGWYEPTEGMKYIMVDFTYENIGSSDAYVSIYDFNCYADNATCEEEYGLDDSDFINTNLSSGRSVSFSVYFSVPEDAESIELEYETNVWTGEKAIIKVQ